MQRIVAVNSNTYHGFPLEAALRGIRQAGFQFIELTATKGWTEHVFPTMSFAELWGIKEMIAESGLTPISLSGHCNLMDRQRIGDFIDNIHLAAFFGCQYIISSVGEAHLQDKAKLSNEQAAQQIRELVPHLAASHLRLGLENHGDHATGQIIQEIVKLVQSQQVMVNYDTGNVIYYSGLDPLPDLAACVDSVGHIHLKDKIGGLREWNFPALGEGSVNFPAIFDLLDQSGNNCPLSIEIEFTGKGPASLEEVDQSVQKSFAYLKKIGLTF